METDPTRADDPVPQPAEDDDESGSKDTPPALPSEDDDTALGDTDQHSDADA
jgi:hypothetical protein